MDTRLFGGFFDGKKILITGHTGFKGAWLSILLDFLGARVIGYSLDPKNKEDLFNVSSIKSRITDIRGDIRDLDNLNRVFIKHKPEIVFHLAAQALVRESYDFPIYTFETNILGTANVLECVRKSDTVRASIIITSDKCYKNTESQEGYTESDELGGYDPYSSSKACAELITDSYLNSFFLKKGKPLATARAGNVIGGGDWSKDRIVPDSIRSLEKNKPVIVRNPDSVRPWQFVLDPLNGYLMLAKRVYENNNLSGAWNFGPDKQSIRTVKQIVESLIASWGSGRWEKDATENNKHETKMLYLNTEKSKKLLNWKPLLNFEDSISFTSDWYKRYKQEPPYELCITQIKKFYSL